MTFSIDGHLHHLRELADIEKEVFSCVEPQKFFEAYKNFLTEATESGEIDLSKGYLETEELKKVDSWIRNYYEKQTGEARVWILRAYIVGDLLGASDVMRTVFRADIYKMPRTVAEAVREYNLTLEEADAISAAIKKSGSFLTNTTENTIQQVREAMLQSISRREGARGVESRVRDMVDEGGELNRDWKRVAITETNIAFTDGYLSRLQDGDYVIGMSLPDACEHCKEDIDGKVYRFRSEPPEAYDNLTGEERAEAERIWEKEVWVGKSNIGRSPSKRKKIDKTKGATADNLVEREHHELSMPAIPYHPYCYCRWIYFDPDYQYVDKLGNIRLKFEDVEAHEKWRRENIK